ncbi:MAG: hypothetical protein ACRDPC_11310 [Solirubrobacteraceae bacterium]
MTSDDEHNSDVIDAIRAVRRVVRDIRVAYLEPSVVTVDADPEYRAAYFRFPHSADADVCIEVRHGDGYSYLRSPVGEYHGYVNDDEFGDFVAAVLEGGLSRTRRLRGGVPVEERLRLRAREGRVWELRSRLYWRALWRLAIPGLDQQFERHTVSFDQAPSVVPGG